MKVRDVKDIIQEALLLYIDDISAIDNVGSIHKSPSRTDDEELEIKFKDGDVYRLMIVHR